MFIQVHLIWVPRSLMQLHDKEIIQDVAMQFCYHIPNEIAL